MRVKAPPPPIDHVATAVPLPRAPAVPTPHELTGPRWTLLRPTPAFAMDILLFDYLFTTAAICFSVWRLGRPREALEDATSSIAQV